MVDKDCFFNDIEFQGSKGLVFIGEKMVVIRRDEKASHYPLLLDLPGGHREENETPFETLRRELTEEIGIEVQEPHIIFSRKEPSLLDASRLTFFFALRPGVTESDIVFGREGIEYLVINPHEYLERTDVILGQQERIREYLNYL